MGCHLNCIYKMRQGQYIHHIHVLYRSNACGLNSVPSEKIEKKNFLLFVPLHIYMFYSQHPSHLFLVLFHVLYI